MKTFLTICTLAMVSAGIYGFVDMAGDVKNGTMIQYDRGENPLAKSVTKSKLLKQSPLTKNEIAKGSIAMNFGNKLLASKVANTNSTAPSLLGFISESYSRGDPSAYLSMEEVPALDLDSTSKPSSVVADSITNHPLATAIVTSITTEPTVATSTDSTQEVSAEDLHLDYSSFSRGDPAPRHKKKRKGN